MASLAASLPLCSACPTLNLDYSGADPRHHISSSIYISLVSSKRKNFSLWKKITTLFHLKITQIPECHQPSNLSLHVVRHLTEKSCSLLLESDFTKGLSIVLSCCLLDPFQSVGFPLYFIFDLQFII